MFILCTVFLFAGHHVKNGCSNIECKSWYCVKCKSTETINLAAGRTSKHCSCIPTIFCSALETSDDVQKFLRLNAFGYPADVRCGCPICPDCRPGRGCEQCTGNCAVCKVADLILCQSCIIYQCPPPDI